MPCYIHTHKTNNIVICGGSEHQNDDKQRAYRQKQHVNNQAAIVENPIRGIRTRSFQTSGRRKNYTIFRNFKIKIKLESE
jgi:hypothetical protein